jgi:Type VI secretion system/phage-baseplate injector OB domain
MSDITSLSDLFDSDGMGMSDPGNIGTKKYYGKYRGTVLNNIDPEQRGRLLVEVPDVLGFFTSNWALPCVPIGGIQMGMYLIPPVRSLVWVEFEQGNPNKPIWVGSFWGLKAEVPAATSPPPPGVSVMIFQTPAQNMLVMSDVAVPVPVTPPMGAGGILLKSGSSSILIDATGIKITGTLVTINNGALVIK